jgi:hypothetical protein
LHRKQAGLSLRVMLSILKLRQVSKILADALTRTSAIASANLVEMIPHD